MGWEVIVAHQEPSTPKCDGTCGNHARITQRAIVIRATKLMVCQSSIFLPPRNNLQQKVSRRHMEFAIITILYLIGFLGVGFCFFQLAGILDRLTYQDQTIDSNKVWIWRSLSIIMEIEYAIQILVSLLIISVGLLILLSVMICSSYYNTLPTLIHQRKEEDKEIK